MNVELLERVKRHILAEPRRVRMEAWAVSERMSEDDKAKARYSILEELYAEEHGVDDEETSYLGFSELLDFPECGTVACIAGWGKVLSQPDPATALSDKDFLHKLFNLSAIEAAELFGLDYNGANRLFHVCNWPDEFESDYEHADTPEERAQAVADRIDHFIKTKGAE